MRLAFALLLAVGCTKPIPDHLKLETPNTSTTGEATDPVEILAAWQRRDPLVRAPALPREPSVLEGAVPLAEFAATVKSVESGNLDAATALQSLEQVQPNTAAVALSRGYRLRMVETLLPKRATDAPEIELELLYLLTPLRADDVATELPRRPLAFLDEPNNAALRPLADRWVLTGWMADPKLDLAPVGEALQQPLYDGLAQTPMGALVLERGKGASADSTEGLNNLRRATVLTLYKVAADRDSEQAAWADMQRAAQDELGGKPIETLLRQAALQLTDAAGDDSAAGGALLALSAERWVGSCPDPSCIGLDRVQSMHMAGQFSAEVQELAGLWKIIALKDALDQMDVGHDTILFPRASVALVDALIGTGAGPFEAHLVQRKVPDNAVWLALGRAVGAEGITDWSGARAALGKHLAEQIDEVSATSTDDEIAELLKRIKRRAVP